MLSRIPSGVYMVPFSCPSGYPIVVAVDERGRMRAFRRITDDMDVKQVRDEMFATLDRLRERAA